MQLSHPPGELQVALAADITFQVLSIRGLAIRDGVLVIKPQQRQANSHKITHLNHSNIALNMPDGNDINTAASPTTANGHEVGRIGAHEAEPNLMVSVTEGDDNTVAEHNLERDGEDSDSTTDDPASLPVSEEGRIISYLLAFNEKLRARHRDLKLRGLAEISQLLDENLRLSTRAKFLTPTNAEHSATIALLESSITQLQALVAEHDITVAGDMSLRLELAERDTLVGHQANKIKMLEARIAALEGKKAAEGNTLIGHQANKIKILEARIAALATEGKKAAVLTGEAEKEIDMLRASLVDRTEDLRSTSHRAELLARENLQLGFDLSDLELRLNAGCVQCGHSATGAPATPPTVPRSSCDCDAKLRCIAQFVHPPRIATNLRWSWTVRKADTVEVWEAPQTDALFGEEIERPLTAPPGGCGPHTFEVEEVIFAFAPPPLVWDYARPAEHEY